jgi:hypothetical protein
MKYSVIRVVGEIMFYLGPAAIGAGVALFLIFAVFLLLIAGVVGGLALSISGYLIYKCGKFKENTEQIASGVSKGIQNLPASQQAPPPPSNICPTCHHPLTFIEQYKAWYCFNCKEYK